MPLFLVGVAALGLKALVVALAITAVVAYFTMQKVIAWFRDRTSLKLQEKNNIAFSLQEKLREGGYKTIQGIFNTDREELLDYQAVKSNRIDEELAATHREEDLVLYQ